MSITSGTYYINTAGTGGYTSISNAEADIAAGGLDGALTFEFNESYLDTTACTLSYTTNGYTLTITASASYRFYSQTGWPNCAAVESLGARLVTTAASTDALTISVGGVTVEWIQIVGKDDGIFVNNSSGSVVLRNLMMRDSSTRGINVNHASTTVTISACFLYRNGSRGINVTAGTVTAYNTTAYAHTGYNYSGLACYDTIGLNGGTSDYNSCTGSYNLSSDATAPGTTEGVDKWTGKIWQQIIQNGNPGEEDLHPTANREWADGLIYGNGFENAASYGVMANVFSGLPTMALESSVVKRGVGSVKATYASTKGAGYDYGSQIADSTASCYFCVPSSFSMTDGATCLMALWAHRGSSDQCYGLRLKRTGSSYSISMYYRNSAGSTVAGTWTAISLDAWIHVIVRYDTTGNMTWWVNGSQIDTAAASAAYGVRFASPISFYTDSGTISGFIYYDHYQFTSSVHIEPDDTTSPYGDSAVGVYTGGSYGYTTDIDGETVTDGYIGADGAVATGGGSALLLRLMDEGLFVGGGL